MSLAAPALPEEAARPWAEPGSGLTRRYRSAGARDWRDFLTLLRLETDFTPVLLTVPDESGADVLRRWLGESLAVRQQEVEEIPARTPEELRLLALRVLEPVVPRAESVRVLWAAAVVGDRDPAHAAWREGWAFALARLNEHRNTLRRRMSQALVLVGAPWLKPLFREVAPDLWSIRSLVLDFAPAADEDQPAPVVSKTGGVLGGFSANHPEETERLRQRVDELRSLGGRAELLAPALVRLADQLIAVEKYSAVEPLASEAVALARATDQKFWRWRAEFALAYALARRSEQERAVQLFTQLSEEAKANGDHAAEASCFQNLGEIAMERSDHAQARECFEKARQLFRAAGEVFGEAQCIIDLADLSLRRWEHAEAKALFEEALPYYRKLGLSLGVANCTLGLGNIALARSQHAEASARFEEARGLYQRVGNAQGEANCLVRLGEVAQDRAEYPEAKAWFEEALPICRRVEDQLGEASCIARLGEIAMIEDDLALAAANFERARKIFFRVGDIGGQANCIRGLGMIALRKHQYEEAETRFQEALPLFCRAGGALGEANSIRSLGEVAALRRDIATAKKRYEKALYLYERAGEPYSIGVAHMRLAEIAAENSLDRATYLAAARRAWESIDRPDLVADLERKFGASPGGG